ncbi:MAG: HAD hydrolase family protein [Firmicutes bacterium]|nr:HAD hydrolase family protein [Bacillota bacterium]
MALYLEIPGREKINLSKMVLDLNGTLTTDGKLQPSTAALLNEVSGILTLYIMTADTLGTAARMHKEVKAIIKTISGDNTSFHKAEFVRSLGADEVIAVGNGDNDAEMLRLSAIGIAVLGQEGCSARAMLSADIVVNDINDVFNMILKPQRLIATLRK